MDYDANVAEFILPEHQPEEGMPKSIRAAITSQEKSIATGKVTKVKIPSREYRDIYRRLFGWCFYYFVCSCVYYQFVYFASELQNLRSNIIFITKNLLSVNRKLLTLHGRSPREFSASALKVMPFNDFNLW